MKKRLLLILAVGIAFSPSVFAMGVVGPLNRSNDAGTAGAAYCKAGLELKHYVAAEESGKNDSSKREAVVQTQSNEGS